MTIPDSLEILLDLGFDYGAQGGPDDFGTTAFVAFSGRSVRNVPRAQELGEWQLGNRNVDRATLQRIYDFWMSVHGTATAFHYLDRNDHLAFDSPLILDGSATAQLTKRYGGYGNDYDKKIVKPNVASLSFKLNGAPLSVASVDAATGVVTFNMPYPAISSPADEVTWSGEFYKPARFTSSRPIAQFLAYEDRGNGESQAIYSLSTLTVTEEPA
ncbi:MAG TPA: DUF2460 domain-containing protein [Steroidobacteraceae bacterium]|nr:DUF2460 domain-containing protein [Steroidobacteraceae bacterium]